MLNDIDSRHLVYATNRVSLIDYATHIVGSRADAEDIVQDAFIRFLPKKPIATGALKSYLFQIVRNLALDQRRRQKLEAEKVEGELPHWTRPQEQSSPEGDAIVGDQVQRLRDYLATLPPKQRLAIEMYRFGGYTLEEIAAQVGTSPASVHRYLRASLVKMASILEMDDPACGR